MDVDEEEEEEEKAGTGTGEETGDEVGCCWEAEQAEREEGAEGRG